MNKRMEFLIQARCANSDRPLEISLDSELKISHVTEGADPMFCLPIVQLANTESPSIVDIF